MKLIREFKKRRIDEDTKESLAKVYPYVSGIIGPYTFGYITEITVFNDSIIREEIKECRKSRDSET